MMLCRTSSGIAAQLALCAVGRPVDVRAYADRIVIRHDGETVAEHPRSFGRGEIAYDPWHYVPILTRKPGALRNGAPFKDWQLPGALGRLRTRLAGRDDGDRQIVKVLAAVQEGCCAMATVTRADLGEAVRREIGLSRRGASHRLRFALPSPHRARWNTRQYY